MVINYISNTLPANKILLFISTCVLTLISLISPPQVFSTPLLLDDGETHYIDYIVDTGILMTGSRSVTLFVEDGALISNSIGTAIRVESGTLNIQGGRVAGNVGISNSFNMSGGVIEGGLTIYSGSIRISGGTISSMFSEASNIKISGGTLGDISTISGGYEISGGSFIGELFVGYDRTVNMGITGGVFTGGFRYGACCRSGDLSPAFSFFGDLSLSTPVQIGVEDGIDEILIYETIVSGTLVDGSFISQTITCHDFISRVPCSGVTISSDDPRGGEFSFDLATHSVSENGNTVLLTVNRINGSKGEASVDFSTSDGTATASIDYQLVSGSLTFADGETNQTIEITLLDDTIYEGDETFSVELSNVQGQTWRSPTLGSVTTAQVVIEEDDPAPPAGVLQFSGTSYSTKENNTSVVVTVLRINGSFGEVSVDYNTTDSTATASIDYQPVSGSLAFADGEISRTIEVALLNDTIYEGKETFNVELSNVQGGVTLGSVTSAQVVIEEDDPAPSAGVLQFSEATYSMDENTPSINVTVARAEGSFGEISVDYNTVDLIATAGEDYHSVSGTLSFADGEISQIITIQLLDDIIYEGDESFTVELNNVQGGATLNGVTKTQVIINEDDPIPPSGILRFSGASYSTIESDVSIIVTVQRDNGSFGEVSVDYNTADSTAAAGEDYQPTSGTLNFSDGETSQTIEIPLLDDITFEGEETFTVELTNLQGGAVLGTISSAQIIISDDDLVPATGVIQFSGASYNVDEDGVSVVVAITRINGSFGEITVDYNTVDVTAIAGEDYQPVSGILTFSDGEISRTIVLKILDDVVVEGDETFKIILSNVQNGAILGTPKSSIITINEDDVDTENDGDSTVSTDTAGSSTGSIGNTGTSAFDPLYLLFMLSYFVTFSNRFRKLKN